MIKVLWVRGLCLPVAFDRYVSSNSQIFVTAALRGPVESLSLICIIPNTDRPWSLFHESPLMPSLTDVTVDMRQHERCSAVMWFYIWSGICVIPRCSPVLTQTKPAAQHYKHVVRAPSQLIHSLLIPHSASQHEQAPCCYETNFLSWNLQKIQSVGQQPAMWTTG